MGYINVFISKSAKIYVKNSQFYVENNEKCLDYPLEDINSVMIENRETTISTYTLSELCSRGIVTFVCNDKHLPAGIILPYCEYYQSLKVFELQNTISKPLKKQLWQNIVKNKIKNQNNVLNICGGNNDLLEFYNSVLSGDTDNTEAKASLIYFKQLFGSSFKRREEENIINAYLNYGYAIIRGFIARQIVASGLIPFIGINHHNQYNPYNLADDLIEPFRPIVDLYVKVYLTSEKEFNSIIKSKLYNLVNYDIVIDNQKQALSHAIEIYVDSFVKSLKENKNMLKDISIEGLNLHSYE